MLKIGFLMIHNDIDYTPNIILISMYMVKIRKACDPENRNYFMHVKSGGNRGSQTRPSEIFQRVSQ